MKALFAVGAGVCACAAVAVGLFFGIGHAAPAEAAPRAATLAAAPAPDRLVVHEWGTFTSFSASDGVPVHFTPNNSDLPAFVYHQQNDGGKVPLLLRAGTVSMETPVLYFYADRPMRASVRVDFPRGWITEWYPFAAAAPAHKGGQPRAEGQSMRWDVRLLTGEPARFPRRQDDNPYYRARETDAVPLQVEVPAREDDADELQGGSIVQREKFLFYRGVGTFAPPMSVAALGGGQVRVRNATGRRVNAAVLVTVKGGQIGFRPLGCVPPGDGLEVALPELNGSVAELSELLVGELTAAGLYEKEARAMVKTWDRSWFGEDGSRLLYLVPRERTDELLPLTVEPKPTEVVRVLVGRHDFLTPEQEAEADRQLRRVKAAQAELQAAEKELRGLGRFSNEARSLAERRLQAQASGK
jgi:hypothetical protein